MIELDSVTPEKLSVQISCKIAPGNFAVILAGELSSTETMLNLLLGIEKPASGKIEVMGYNVSESTEEELLLMRKKIGVLHKGGGLISNLKVLENVTLPLLYHSELSESEIRRLALAAVEQTGYRGSLTELPGNLSIHQRVFIGFARILITNPKIVIYNFSFEAFHTEELRGFITLANNFHKQLPGRISIAIANNLNSLAGLPINSTFNFNQGE